jgi:hypothetical protein
MTTNTQCPQCHKAFATVFEMQQHFRDTHRKGQTAEAIDGDGPESMVTAGAVPAKRCGNCLYFGRANNITVCRRDPGAPGMANGAGGVMVPVCFLPPKFVNDWCGQWTEGEWPVRGTPQT